MWLLEHYPKTCTFVLFVIVASVAVPTAVIVRYTTYVRLAYRQYTRSSNGTTVSKASTSIAATQAPPVSADEEEGDLDDSDEEGLPPPPSNEVGSHAKYE